MHSENNGLTLVIYYDVMFEYDLIKYIFELETMVSAALSA